MDFQNYLEEAYSDRMKKSIDKKLLTKVGKALAKHVGVGVEQSQFTYVPGYRFRLGAAHPYLATVSVLVLRILLRLVIKAL